jgi:hypothetical protein
MPTWRDRENVRQHRNAPTRQADTREPNVHLVIRDGIVTRYLEQPSHNPELNDWMWD